MERLGAQLRSEGCKDNIFVRIQIHHSPSRTRHVSEYRGTWVVKSRLDLHVSVFFADECNIMNLT